MTTKRGGLNPAMIVMGGAAITFFCGGRANGHEVLLPDEQVEAVVLAEILEVLGVEGGER